MSKRRSNKRKGIGASLTQPLVYGAVRSLAAGVNIAGLESSVRAARVLGGAYAVAPFNTKRLDRARANLRWVSPDWPEERIETTAVDSYRHLITLAMEVACTPRMITPDGWARRVAVGDLQDAVGRLLSGKPAILITGHCGNWEILGAWVASLGIPIHALYRPLDLAPLDRWLRRTRQYRGLGLIDKFGAFKVLPEYFARGDSVAFIADQNAGDRGVFVPFFDRLASTYKSIGLLAMEYEVPIICGGARRLGEPGELGLKYEVAVDDIITPGDWVDQPDPLFYITARYRRSIETMVMRAPEQYLWMHRAWKSRPRFERAGKPFPGSLRAKLEELPWMTQASMDRIIARSAQDTEEYAQRTDRRR